MIRPVAPAKQGELTRIAHALVRSVLPARTWPREHGMTGGIAAFDTNHQPLTDLIISHHDRHRS